MCRGIAREYRHITDTWAVTITTPPKMTVTGVTENVCYSNVTVITIPIIKTALWKVFVGNNRCLV